MATEPNQEAYTFYADSRFERLARRPGGVAREQALASAQAHVDDLKLEFATWLDRELHELSAALSPIEGNVSNTSSLERAYLSCAQLRDVGATMGYELITFVANNLCEILDAFKAGAAHDKDMIDCHIDAFWLARMDQYRNLRPEEVPEMASGLRRVVELASKIRTPDIK